jgi:hypothetical protein
MALVWLIGRKPEGAVSGHRINVWWLDRWASDGPTPSHVEFTGTDQEILALLDRHEVDVLPVVKIVIDQPNPFALSSCRWDASLSADGELAVVMANDGNVLVGVEPGSESRRGKVELRDPRGQLHFETADVIVRRELAFAGLRAWLAREQDSVPGLTWDLYRTRGRN